jgi:hypothetical protein
LVQIEKRFVGSAEYPAEPHGPGTHHHRAALGAAGHLACWPSGMAATRRAGDEPVSAAVLVGRSQTAASQLW